MLLLMMAVHCIRFGTTVTVVRLLLVLELNVHFVLGLDRTSHSSRVH